MKNEVKILLETFFKNMSLDFDLQALANFRKALSYLTKYKIN